MKNLYPAWFPYPVSWLRAIASALLLFFLGICLRVTGFLGVLLSSHDDYSMLFTMLTIGCLIFVMSVTCAHHILLGKKNPKLPAWIPGPSSLREGMNAFIVIIPSLLPSSWLLGRSAIHFWVR
jgi:hypothetical protein